MNRKILFIPTSNSGVTWWRMWNFANSAYKTGLADIKLLWWQKGLTTTHPWEEDITKPEYKLRVFKEMATYAQEADAIVMQMVHIEPSLGAFYTLKDLFPNKPLLAEIDDNMIDTAYYNPASDVYDPAGTVHRKVAEKQFKSADGLIVSTPYLKQVYSEWNDNIYVVPNAIDHRIWGNVKKKGKPGIRIGWAGGMTHQKDLEILVPVIERIIAKNKNVTFVLCYGVPTEYRNIPGVEYVGKWSRIDRYPQYLADRGLDIAVAPLVDNAFNRGKSNLRWLEASALGIPTVAMNVGHFAETIQHGIDGFLADNADEMEKHIQTLIDDKRLRMGMGRAANIRTQTDFNVDIVLNSYLEAIETAIKIGDQGKVPPYKSSWEDEITPLEPIVPGGELDNEFKSNQNISVPVCNGPQSN